MPEKQIQKNFRLITPEIKKHLKLGDAQLKQLERLHNRYIGDFREVINNDIEYRKRLVAYREAAEKEGICIHDSHKFHMAATKEIEMELRPDTTGGQRPIISVNCDSSDPIPQLFATGVQYVDENKVLRDSVFSLRVKVGDREAKFSTQSYYINDQLIKAKCHVLAAETYIATVNGIGFTEEKNKAAVEFWGDQLHRTAGKLHTGGFDFIKEHRSLYREIYNEGTDMIERTYFPLMVHDLKTCEFYVLEGPRDKPYSEWERVPFQKWLRGTGLYDQFGAIRKIDNKVEMHKGETEHYAKGVKQNVKKRKKKCCDSRHSDVYDNGEDVEKLMGSILTKKEKIDELSDIDNTDTVENDLHTKCGYVHVAMNMHEAGKKLEKLYKEARALQKGEPDYQKRMRHLKREISFLKSGIRRVEKGTMEAFDIKKMEKKFEMLSGKKMDRELYGILDELFKSHISDTRHSVQDMFEKGILVWDSERGTFAMPAALELEKELGPDSHLILGNRGTDEARAKQMENEYYTLLTVFVAKQEHQKWIAAANEFHDQIIAARIKAAERLGIPVTDEIRRIPRVEVWIDHFEPKKSVRITDNYSIADAERELI